MMGCSSTDYSLCLFCEQQNGWTDAGCKREAVEGKDQEALKPRPHPSRYAGDVLVRMKQKNTMKSQHCAGLFGSMTVRTLRTYVELQCKSYWPKSFYVSSVCRRVITSLAWDFFGNSRIFHSLLWLAWLVGHPCHCMRTLEGKKEWRKKV